MNTSRLNELAVLLIATESATNFQGQLDQLRNQLDALVGNPGDPSTQQGVSQTLENLHAALVGFEQGLTPARSDAVRAIGAWPYFSSSMSAGIKVLLAENAITASVVRDRVVELQSQRNEYLQRLQETRRALFALGAAGEAQPEGVELGFLLPRPLFKNSLKGLGEEFTQLNRIIDVFSELTTGSVEPVELRELSTTDPLVWVALAAPTAAALAKGVNWVLDAIKKVLEIRNLYEQSKTLKVPEEFLEGLKSHIEATVNEALGQATQELIAAYRGDAGRQNELEASLNVAMKSLYAKIERGMTVEVRALAPPSIETDEPEVLERQAQVAATYGELDRLAQALEFPRLTGDPMIPLEPPGD